jgi:hypothetical protein
MSRLLAATRFSLLAAENKQLHPRRRLRAYVPPSPAELLEVTTAACTMPAATALAAASGGPVANERSCAVATYWWGGLVKLQVRGCCVWRLVRGWRCCLLLCAAVLGKGGRAWCVLPCAAMCCDALPWLVCDAELCVKCMAGRWRCKVHPFLGVLELAGACCDEDR